MKSELWLNHALIDIVFERRNKQYGAFDLRRRYDQIMARAMLISIGIFVAAWIGVSIWQNRDKVQEIIAEPWHEVIVTDYVPKPVQPVKPPASAPQPKPAAPTTAFVMPAVVDEEIDVVEANIPTQAELANTSIGTNTDPASVEGTGTASNDNGNGMAVIPAEEPEETAPVNFYEVDQKPEFPGGEKAMYDYLRRNLQYPPLARETKLEGTVVVRFVIDKDGQVVQVEVLRSPSNVFNAEALRVIQNMPEWKPASRHGKKVATYFMLPLKFDLL